MFILGDYAERTIMLFDHKQHDSLITLDLLFIHNSGTRKSPIFGAHSKAKAFLATTRGGTPDEV